MNWHGQGSDADRPPGERSVVHWSGLPRRSRQVAVYVLAVTMLADLVLLALDYREFGLQGIAGGYYAVDWWDVAKALGIGATLLLAAPRERSIRVLALVFLLVAVEDLITLHGFFSYALAAVTGNSVPRPLGELIAFTGFGFLVFVLVWGGQPPRDPMFHRARLIITVLVVVLFLFTGVVDFFAGETLVSPLSLIEESGERLVFTFTIAYAAGLLTADRLSG